MESVSKRRTRSEARAIPTTSQGFVDSLGVALDLEDQFDIAMEWETKMYEWMPSVQIASFVSPWAMGPNVSKWVYPYHTSSWPDELFSAVPAR